MRQKEDRFNSDNYVRSNVRLGHWLPVGILSHGRKKPRRNEAFWSADDGLRPVRTGIQDLS